MNLDARPFPVVARAGTPGEWLRLSHFDHGDHVTIQGLTCEACHARATASTATADLLVPGSRPVAAATAARQAPRGRGR